MQPWGIFSSSIAPPISLAHGFQNTGRSQHQLAAPIPRDGIVVSGRLAYAESAPQLTDYTSVPTRAYSMEAIIACNAAAIVLCPPLVGYQESRKLKSDFW
jgi:hypothetical protein